MSENCKNEKYGVCISPGCVYSGGKVYLNDYRQYEQYLKNEQKYEELYNQIPGDSDYKVSYGNQVVRLSGVMLVDKYGKSRNIVDIKTDMITRLSYLKSRKAPSICIEQLEKFIAEIENK